MGYSNNINVQMLIRILKENNISRVVASPGTTNIEFVHSIEDDPDFNIISCVDERSAAYIACGMAEESGEPVVLSCTGATASRNYLSALTEAFYRKLPILAITSSQHIGHSGNHMPQMIDRMSQPKDTVNISVQIPACNSEEDQWANNVAMNKAILELKHRGGGPAHINLVTTYSSDFSLSELPQTRIITRYEYKDEKPTINAKRIAIIVGAHSTWSHRLQVAVDEFCVKYNAVVIHDHISNYKGNYGIDSNIIQMQAYYTPSCRNADLVIHLGSIAGVYLDVYTDKVWRVNPDGEIRDTFRKLTSVFEMDETDFFEYYNKRSEKENTSYYDEWKKELQKIVSKMPDVPFSNVWIAKNTINKLPENCNLYLGILNSLRTWDYFLLSKSIVSYCNTGGFGIDGTLSSAVGVSIENRDKICFVVLGDLSFFYDMNVMGNRHLGSNLRVLLVNNGKGAEFTNYDHPAYAFGKGAERHIAAAGHFGNKSSKLVKHFAEDLGFTYLSASTKDEYNSVIDKFVEPTALDTPLLLEVFTDSEDESNAIKQFRAIEVDAKGSTKHIVKSIVGDKGVNAIKKMLGK